MTGIDTASTTALTRSTARSIWHMSAEPPPVLTTFRTGQPMLMSTAVAPFSSTQRAACSISEMTLPVKLDRERAVALASLGQLERSPVLLQQRPRVDQVGRRQPEPAAFAHRQPVRQAGVTSQRRQEESRWDRYLAQRERFLTMGGTAGQCIHRLCFNVNSRPEISDESAFSF